MISDPTRGVDAATLLDTIEELRDAGAEAIQINSVRVVASTYFVDRPTGVSVDGQALTSPYKITAIGDPRTIAAALRIPGGVVETIRGVGGDVTIDERNSVTVSVLHAPKTPQYARPAS